MSQYENAGFVYVRDSDEQILDDSLYSVRS